MHANTFSLSALVADGDDYSRQETAGFLGHCVSRIHQASDGRTAFQLYEEHVPDILLVDLVLPDMDGSLLLRRVRELDPDIPVIILYDGYAPSTVLKVLEFNVSAFLFKPVSPEKLRASVGRIARTLFLKRQLLEARYTLEHLLNMYPSFAAMVEDGKLAYLNRRFLEYLGFKNFEQFKACAGGLDAQLREVNGQPYQGENSAWISQLTNDPLDRDHMIRLANPRHPEQRTQAFIVAFNQFPIPGRYLFTFTEVSELDEERAALESRAFTDPLTGALNRRSFLDRLSREHLRLLKGGDPFSLVMFDIDHFKAINDEFGHDVGDAVLKELTNLVLENIREGDCLGRWGGEEFMLLEPRAGLDSATRLAERLRAGIAACGFTGVPRPVTSSFGVVQHRPHEDLDQLTKRVDQALYKAKNSGRNRVISE
ncbi:MAG: diguanylate cyclase [Desulfovibrio sp.]